MARRERSATFWKIVVGAISSAVVTTMAVSTLLDRPEDEDNEPSITETSAAQIPTPAAETVTRIQTPVPSNPTIAAAPATTVVVTESIPAAPMPAPERVVATPIGVAPAAATADVAEAPTEADAAPVAEAPTASPAAPPLRDRNGNLVDPDDHGSNPNAPALSAGAGQFKTEAPPWSASSFQSDPNAGAGQFTTAAPPWSASSWVSDPNAGAGPFTTDWNIPAYGAYWGY